jgi:probable HAF family extracellular repeat protein
MVGTSGDSSGNSRGFLYADGAMVDLTSLLNPALNVVITSATGINDAGQIVDTAYNTVTGEGFGVILTPVPEPSSVILAALGGLALLAVVKRSAPR